MNYMISILNLAKIAKIGPLEDLNITKMIEQEIVLSTVCTLYGSERYILDFHRRISVVLKNLCINYEIIFVVDGSKDDSIIIARSLQEQDVHVCVIDLSKNFGHHAAIMVGLEHAKGQYIYLTDVDCEEPPEEFLKYWNEMISDNDLDVVKGVHENRTIGLLSKTGRALFYKIYKSLAIEIPQNETLSRLMSKKYVKELIKYRERNLFLPAIWKDMGFSAKQIITKKEFDGYSTYTLSKKMKMAYYAIISSSDKPLYFVFYTGLIISGASFTGVIILLFKKLMSDISPIIGWTSLMLAICFMGGIMMLSIGILGLYLARIYDEIRQRPRSIIRKIYE